MSRHIDWRHAMRDLANSSLSSIRAEFPIHRPQRPPARAQKALCGKQRVLRLPQNRVDGRHSLSERRLRRGSTGRFS